MKEQTSGLFGDKKQTMEIKELGTKRKQLLQAGKTGHKLKVLKEIAQSSSDETRQKHLYENLSK